MTLTILVLNDAAPSVVTRAREQGLDAYIDAGRTQHTTPVSVGGTADADPRNEQLIRHIAAECERMYAADALAASNERDLESRPYEGLEAAVRRFPVVIASGNKTLAKALLVQMRYAVQALETELADQVDLPR